MPKFSFDGENLKIKMLEDAVENGRISFSTVELYSAWKEWVQIGDNAKFLPAFRVLGGDPIGGGQFVGFYLFFRNDLGWRGVPPAINPCTVIIDGSFFGEDPDLEVMENLEAQATDLIINRSSLTTKVEVSVPTLTEEQILTLLPRIAESVWGYSRG